MTIAGKRIRPRTRWIGTHPLCYVTLDRYYVRDDWKGDCLRIWLCGWLIVVLIDGAR